MQVGGTGWSGTGAQGVVPVVVERSEALDGGVACAHGLGHAVADRVAVEAAVDGHGRDEERREPGGIWSRPGGGEAARVGVQEATADRVDSRFS